MTKLFFACLAFLLIFLFAFSVSPIFADENIKKDDRIFDGLIRDDLIDEREVPEAIAYLDGRWFFDYDIYYNYLIENYSVSTSRHNFSSADFSYLSNRSFVFNNSLTLSMSDFSRFSLSSGTQYDLFFCGSSPFFNFYLDFEHDNVVYFYFLNGVSTTSIVYLNNQWSNSSYRYVNFSNVSTVTCSTGSSNNSDLSSVITIFNSWLSSNATEVAPPVVCSFSTTNGSMTLSDGVNSSSVSPFQTDSGNNVTVTVTPSTGYDYPSSISVSGTYGSITNSGSGVFVISNVTSNLTISATCPLQYNTSSITVTNGTAILTSDDNSSVSGSSGSVSVGYGRDLTVAVTPSAGYVYPSTLTVSGSYSSLINDGSGEFTIEGVASALTITVVCPAYVAPSYTVSLSVTNGAGALSSDGVSSDSLISVTEGHTVSVSIVPAAGYDYPDSLSVSGTYGTINHPGSGLWTISNVQSALSISASCPVTVIPSYSVTYNFLNCSTSAPASVQRGSTLSGTITPAAGYTYPSAMSGHSAGIPVTINYNSSTGAFSIANVTGPLELYAQAVSLTADYSVTYDLENCTCTMSVASVSHGDLIQFSIVPNAGYLMSDRDTSVSDPAGVQYNVSPDNSYGFYYSFYAESGDIEIVGVAIPWREALTDAYNRGYTNGGGSSGYSGTYLDGYNTGFNDGINSVNSSSDSALGLDRYNSVYQSGYNSACADIRNGGDTPTAYSVYKYVFDGAFASGVYSVADGAPLDSISETQYNLVYTTGIVSVSEDAPLGSLSRDTYSSIYNLGYDAGLSFGESSGVSEAFTSFIPSTLAAIGGGLLYVGDHISIFGITLISVVGLVILLAVGIWLFKLFKGSL